MPGKQIFKLEHKGLNVVFDSLFGLVLGTNVDLFEVVVPGNIVSIAVVRIMTATGNSNGNDFTESLMGTY